MAWTKWDLMFIERYTIAVIGGTMIIDQVPEKHKAEVQLRVDAYFTVEALAAQQATQI